MLEDGNPGAVALFVAGCGADCNPLPRLDPAGELGRMYGAFRILGAFSESLAHVADAFYLPYCPGPHGAV